MIVFYRRREEPSAEEIEDTLEELVLAHRVVYVDGRKPDDLPSTAALPALVEGEDVYSGGDIDAFLDKRRNRLQISRQMSADACFLDPDDPEHCI